MCDYSLEHQKSRAAVEGEDLVIHAFVSGTKGFVGAGGALVAGEVCAVCCKDGVEMICYLDGQYNVRNAPKPYSERVNVSLHGEIPVVFHTMRDTGDFVHRDGFLIPGGQFLSVQDLLVGTRATVTKALPPELSEAAKGDVAFKEEDRIADVAPLVQPAHV
jgi:hypothetical protein